MCMRFVHLMPSRCQSLSPCWHLVITHGRVSCAVWHFRHLIFYCCIDFFYFKSRKKNPKTFCAICKIWLLFTSKAVAKTPPHRPRWAAEDCLVPHVQHNSFFSENPYFCPGGDKPKVQIPYKTRPGSIPRKLAIERCVLFLCTTHGICCCSHGYFEYCKTRFSGHVSYSVQYMLIFPLLYSSF